MRRALESLPWVRKAIVNYDKRQATVTVLTDKYEEAALAKVLKDAGFGGTLVKSEDAKPKTKPAAGPRVAFKVSGMKKTKSGAT